MRRPVLAVLAAVAVIAPAAAADARAASCANADRHPYEATVAQLRSATICLLNAERRSAGLRPLRANAGLALAGQRHARDMVRRRYFAHASRSGAGFLRRIMRAGYVRRGRGALVGENLAWGVRGRSTPRAIVRSWMRSPGHRANVLRRRFREVGIGVVRHSPAGHRHAATYVAEFGRRY